MRDWYIGMEVVCVDKTPYFWTGGPNVARLELNKVYRIRGFDKDPPYVILDKILGLGVYLEEIVLETSDKTGKEYAYYARRFRPVEKIKSRESLEVFKGLLAGKPVNGKEEPKRIVKELVDDKTIGDKEIEKVGKE